MIDWKKEKKKKNSPKFSQLQEQDMLTHYEVKSTSLPLKSGLLCDLL